MGREHIPFSDMVLCLSMLAFASGMSVLVSYSIKAASEPVSEVIYFFVLECLLGFMVLLATLSVIEEMLRMIICGYVNYSIRHDERRGVPFKTPHISKEKMEDASVIGVECDKTVEPPHTPSTTPDFDRVGRANDKECILDDEPDSVSPVQ